MKNSRSAPATIAAVDQIRATVDTTLDAIITEFQSHTADHDGETSCPFAATWMKAEMTMRPTDIAALLAAAVARLAAPTPGMPQL